MSSSHIYTSLSLLAVTCLAGAGVGVGSGVGLMLSQVCHLAGPHIEFCAACLFTNTGTALLSLL